jgi:hypothetical protein
MATIRVAFPFLFKTSLHAKSLVVNLTAVSVAQVCLLGNDHFRHPIQARSNLLVTVTRRMKSILPTSTEVTNLGLPSKSINGDKHRALGWPNRFPVRDARPSLLTRWTVRVVQGYRAIVSDCPNSILQRHIRPRWPF